MERKSELKVLWGYLIVVGCYLLGVDVQQILLLMTDAEAYSRDIRQLVTEANGKGGTAIASGLPVALYGAYRTYIKSKRVE